MRGRHTGMLHSSAAHGVVALALCGAVGALHACAQVLGIDGEYGDLPQQDGGDGSDDGSDATPDDGAAPDRFDDASPDAEPCDGTPGECVNGLPEGWDLILISLDRSAACPPGFGQDNVLADAVAGEGACDCSCTLTPEPSCATGQLSTRWSDTTASCANIGAAINVSGSACTAFLGTFSNYFAAAPLSAVAGCEVAPTTDDSKVTGTELRVCQVPSGCTERVCAGNTPAGFFVCVASNGDVGCPSGWDTRNVVGDAAELSCTECTCQASAGCADARISFFSDGECATPLAAFDVNDTCQSTNGGGSIRSYTYTATVVDAACTADGPKTPSLALLSPRTVCCRT